MEVVSEEQMNGFRLQLTREKIREALEKRFLKIIPNANDQKALYNEMKRHEKLLKGLKQKKILKQPQFDVLLPSSCQTKLIDIDETLFMLLLRQKDISGFSEPSTGWFNEPFHTDRSDEANLVRFQIGRNQMQHSPVSVSNAEFKKIFGLLKCALLEYGCKKDDIDFILTSCLDETTMQRLKQSMKELSAEKDRANHLENCLEGFSYKLLPTHDKFTGRQSEVEELHQQLSTLHQENIGVNINGMPGVGKTEIARYYCNNYKEEYNNNILWINGENKASIEAGFQNITDIIKLDSKDKDGKPYKSEVLANKLYVYFGNHRLLIVFDNVQNFEDIKSFLPPSTLPVKPSIILTSQNKDFKGLFKQYELTTFSMSDAAHYIGKHSSVLNCTTEAEELICLLEYHPLALAHAVGYTNTNSMTFTEYKELYEIESHELLSEAIPNNLEHINVMTTFRLALKRLQTDNVALKLLNFMSHIDGKEIYKGLLIDLCANSKIQLNKALQSLLNYCLVSSPDTSVWEEFIEQTVIVHSLVQIASQNEQKKTSTFDKIVAELLDVILKDSSLNCVSKDTGKYWWKHLVYMANQKSTERITISRISKIQSYIEKVLFLHSRFDEASTIFKKVLSASRCENKWETKSSLAHSLIHAGDLTGAIEMYRNLLEERLQIYPENDLFVLKTKHGLANCLSEKGDLNEALEIYQTLLHEYTNISSPLKVAEMRENIAVCYSEQGYLTEAIKIHKDVLKVQKELLKEDDANRIGTEYNIAYCLKQQGHYREAAEVLKRVLDVQDTIFPSDHTDVLRTKQVLAACLYKTSSTNEAMELYQELLTIYEARYERNHPDILNVKTGIASCLFDKNQFSEALNLYEQVYSEEVKISPVDRPEMLLCTINIADCLFHKGEFSEAFKCYELLLQNNIEALIPDVTKHITMSKIERCLKDKKYPERPLQFYIKLLNAKINHSTDANEVMIIKENIFKCLASRGRYYEAIQILHDMINETNEKNHVLHARLLFTLAFCLQKVGDDIGVMNIFYVGAIRILDEADSIMERINERDHEVTQQIKQLKNLLESLLQISW